MRTFEIRENEWVGDTVSCPRYTVKVETDTSDRRDPPTRYTNNTTDLYQALQDWLMGGKAVFVDCEFITNDNIPKLIEDIKGIVAVLDPEGYKWAEETKKARERNE
jgi:hypothetical protein